MLAPVINEFRLSMIFGRTVLGPLAGAEPPCTGRLAFAVERGAYAAWFESMRSRKVSERPGAADLTPPWPSHAEQGFWSRYLQEPDGVERPLADISGQQAFRKLVPARVALPLAVIAPLDDTAVTTEGFVWPWGLAVVVTVRHRRPLSPLELMARASMRLLKDLYVATAGGDAKALTEHVEVALDQLANEAFCAATTIPWDDDPFTVHSTVQASGARANFDPAREDVRRVLQAVTGFSPEWEDDTLRELEQSRVAGRTLRPPDHIVFGLRHGRAIWAPSSFLAASGGTHSVGCQHRNLVMGTMQTESLIGLVRATAAHLRDGRPLAMEHRAVALRAVGTLVRLWEGAGIYRSGAIKAQVMDERHRDDINTVRSAVDQPAVQFS